MTTTEVRKPLAHTASRFKQPPGPPSSWALKNTLAFRSEPLAFLAQMTREYGDICRVPLLIGPVIVLHHPNYIRSMLVEHPKRYDKHIPLFNTARLLLGDGLATAEGEVWQKERRLLQPAFHKQHLNTFSKVMTDGVPFWLDRWQARVDSDHPVDMIQEMHRLTLFLLSQTIFSDSHIGRKQLDDLWLSISEPMNFLGQYFWTPFPPLFVPTKKNRGFKQMLHRLDSIIYSLIEERRSQRVLGHDLLGLMLSARDEESGEGMSDLQIRDELVTFFVGGSETTANTLIWLFYLLSQHPEVQERLDEEVGRVLAGRLPTFDDIPQFVYTRMVIEETLRFYPQAAILMRRNLEEEELGGYTIPRSCCIIYSPYLIHRHSAFWEDPERFWPERFSPDQNKSRHPQAYIPFGTGPRLCIAKHFALMEMTLVLAILTSRYRLHLVPGQSIVPEFRISLVTINSLQMYVRTRGASKPRLE